MRNHTGAVVGLLLYLDNQKPSGSVRYRVKLADPHRHYLIRLDYYSPSRILISDVENSYNISCTNVPVDINGSQYDFSYCIPENGDFVRMQFKINGRDLYQAEFHSRHNQTTVNGRIFGKRFEANYMWKQESRRRVFEIEEA